MHEFSLASDIVDIVTQSAVNAEAKKVLSITLEIGEISGVEEPALMTALDSLMPGTIMEMAKIEVIKTQGLARCNECKTEYEIKDMFTLCPVCNSYYKEIISGKEFNVKSLDIE